VLADALEAVFGAIFLDGGYPAARRAVLRAFGVQLAQLDPGTMEKDAKTSLQELLHSRGQQPPAYRVITTHGAPHQRSFDVECAVGELTTMGCGSSRQRAEQEAAAAMLEKLQ
jgi:ribonuclease-3